MSYDERLPRAPHGAATPAAAGVRSSSGRLASHSEPHRLGGLRLSTVERDEYHGRREAFCCREVDRVERADTLLAADHGCPFQARFVRRNHEQPLEVISKAPSNRSLLALVEAEVAESDLGLGLCQR